MFSWKWLVRATYIKKRTQKQSSPKWPSFYLASFLAIFLLAFANAQMHHISLALTILPPHLFLLHAQPKSRKIAFITAAWLKGTFVNVAWSLYLPMPTSLNPPPGSRVCVSLSTCMAPSFSLFLWLSSLWHYSSLFSELVPLSALPIQTPGPDGFRLSSSSQSTCLALIHLDR